MNHDVNASGGGGVGIATHCLKLEPKSDFKIYTLKNPELSPASNFADHGPKQVEEFLNVVGIIFPIKHWNCAVLRLIIRKIPVL